MDKLLTGALKLGIQLSPPQLEQFETYYHELVDWNKKMNLTAITDYEEVQIKHFLDSLTIIAATGPGNLARPLHVIDIGTGAGLPGIPLKIACTHIRLVLLEATAKKTKFLGHLIKQLGLKDVEIVAGRAEDIAHDARYREKFDLVLARAVASLPVLVELALPFCAVGGYFVAQKKGEIQEEIEQSDKGIALMGGCLREIKKVEMEELSDDRVLVIIDKIKSTPPVYPRHPGIPAKKPLLK